MSYETLTLQTDTRGIARLTLNRADKKNAMSAKMIEELAQAAGAISADDAIRAVVLSGSGDTFCAGGDLKWMRAQIDADRATRINEARKLAMALKALNEMPKPMIGAIHGGAFGGGVGLASVCDVALASAGAKFGLTETRLGLIPATISPYVLARMGEGKARRVFMSSRLFDADEAQELGLIARVLPDRSALDAAALTEAEAYLNTAPGAVGAAKALARRLGPVIDDALIEDTITRLADTWETPEAAAGIDAFLTRSAPPWAVKS